MTPDDLQWLRMAGYGPEYEIRLTDGEYQLYKVDSDGHAKKMGGEQLRDAVGLIQQYKTAPKLFGNTLPAPYTDPQGRAMDPTGTLGVNMGTPYLEVNDGLTAAGQKVLPDAPLTSIDGSDYIPARGVENYVQTRGPGLFDYLAPALILGAGGALASGAAGGGSIFGAEAAAPAVGAEQAAAPVVDLSTQAGAADISRILGTGTPLSSLVTPDLQAPAPVVDLSTQAGAADISRTLGPGLQAPAPVVDFSTPAQAEDISRILGPAAATGAAGAAGKAGAATGGTALSRLLGLGQTGSDVLSVLGGLAPAALGVYQSKQEQDAYERQANEAKALQERYFAMGEPYRGLLSQSYQPGFSIADQPDFQSALDTGTQAAARALSTGGNPALSPTAQGELQKYVTGSLALPQLNTYRSQLGTFGQLGTNQAGTAASQAAAQGSNAIQAGSGVYGSIGHGLGNILNPEPSLDDLLKRLSANRAGIV